MENEDCKICGSSYHMYNTETKKLECATCYMRKLVIGTYGVKAKKLWE